MPFFISLLHNGLAEQRRFLAAASVLLDPHFLLLFGVKGCPSGCTI
jgi:hypothetical protein